MAIPVILSSCGAATGAVYVKDCIYAVNGIDCVVENTTAFNCISTARPYSFLSYCNGCILAIEGFCSNKVYILDCCFREIGSLCFTSKYGPLSAAYKTDTNRLVLTFAKAIAVTDSLGNLQLQIANITCNEAVFISAFPLSNGILIALRDGAFDHLQFRSYCGKTQSCILPNCVSIKSFLQFNDCTVYGLIGKGYPYRYLCPVVIDGLLNCVNENCFNINNFMCL